MFSRFTTAFFLIGLSLTFSSPAHAVCLLNHKLAYHYHAQRMDEALQDFAHRSGCFVQIAPDAMKDHKTAPIHGHYRPLTALRRLLRHLPTLKAESTEDGLLVRDTRHRT